MTTDHVQQSYEKFLQYWHVLARNWWQSMIGGFTCLLLLTLVIAKLPSEYEATTTILVDPQQVPEKYVSAAVTSDPNERMNTLTQQILSRTRLQDIMQKVKLYDELKGKLSEEELVQRMHDHIRIQVKQGSGAQLSTFTISFQGSNPALAADVANGLARSFIQWNIDNREQQVEGTQAFLSSELQEAKQNLEEQENKLRVFKMSHLGETPDQTTPNLQAITTLRAALQTNSDAYARLEQEKLLLMRLPESAPPTGVSNPPLSKRGRLEAEKQQVESDLNRWRQSYSERYPDVIKLNRRLEELTAELNSLPPDSIGTSGPQTGETSATAVRLELIDKEQKRLKKEQAGMESQIAAYQAKIDAAPLREQQLVELTRNYDVSKQHYQTLLDKSFNIEMAASLEQKQKGERFTVLDAAQVPEKPVAPRRKALLLLALLASMALPCASVIGKEMLSARISTEAELKVMLPKGAQIVGLIPRISTAADRRGKLLVAITAVATSFLLCLSTAWLVWQMRPLL
jgi:polysaccharide chain length determinant protein (PEP-CTERM system associated)